MELLKVCNFSRIIDLSDFLSYSIPLMQENSPMTVSIILSVHLMISPMEQLILLSSPFDDPSALHALFIWCFD
jgi:hypothetical protein